MSDCQNSLADHSTIWALRLIVININCEGKIQKAGEVLNPYFVDRVLQQINPQSAGYGS
jgi:hypothetical protein